VNACNQTKIKFCPDFVTVILLQTGGDVAVPERQCTGVGGDVLERGWGGDGGEGRSTDERR